MRKLLTVVVLAAAAFAGQGDAKAFLESGKVALGAQGRPTARWR